MDINEIMDMSSIIHALWISIWILKALYGYPCMDLLWILELGTWLFGINPPHEVIGLTRLKHRK